MKMEPWRVKTDIIWTKKTAKVFAPSARIASTTAWNAQVLRPAQNVPMISSWLTVTVSAHAKEDWTLISMLTRISASVRAVTTLQTKAAKLAMNFCQIAPRVQFRLRSLRIRLLMRLWIQQDSLSSATHAHSKPTSQNLTDSEILSLSAFDALIHFMDAIVADKVITAEVASQITLVKVVAATSNAKAVMTSFQIVKNAKTD